MTGRVRKQPWHSVYKPDVVRGLPLIPNVASGLRFYSMLEHLIGRMTHETEMELKHLFRGDTAREYFAMDASVSVQAKVLTNALMKKFDDLFAKHARPIAEQVASEADKNSKTSVRASISKLGGDFALSASALTAPDLEIIQATVANNVGLIKSIPEQYLNEVQSAVFRSITTGNGLADLVPFLAKHKEITLGRARLIARTQTTQAYGAMNISRMRNIGLKKFEWLHSQGGHEPRPLHKNVLNHQIFSIDNPPIIQEAKGSLPEVRGYPGQLISCRCVAVPVFEFS